MTPWKAAASVAALAIGAGAMSIGAAQSADVPYVVDVPQIVEAPQYVEPVAVGGGWYLRGDVGVSVKTETEFYNRTLANQNPERPVPGGKFIDTHLDKGLSVGVGAGYRFNKFFRVDATAEFRGSIGFAAVDKYEFFTQSDPFCEGYDGFGNCTGFTTTTVKKLRNNFYRGSLSSQVYLANAYADLGTFGRITPFIGAGIGAARHSISGVHDWDPTSFDGGAYTKGHSSNWDLAYALHAGLGFKASKNLTLEAGYRYLNLGDAVGEHFTEVNTSPCCAAGTFDGHELKDIDSHEVRLGMRWEFGGDDHYAEPIPVAYPDVPYKH